MSLLFSFECIVPESTSPTDLPCSFSIRILPSNFCNLSVSVSWWIVNPCGGLPSPEERWIRRTIASLAFLAVRRVFLCDFDNAPGLLGLIVSGLLRFLSWRRSISLSWRLCFCFDWLFSNSSSVASSLPLARRALCRSNAVVRSSGFNSITPCPLTSIVVPIIWLPWGKSIKYIVVSCLIPFDTHRAELIHLHSTSTRPVSRQFTSKYPPNTFCDTLWDNTIMFRSLWCWWCIVDAYLIMSSWSLDLADCLTWTWAVFGVNAMAWIRRSRGTSMMNVLAIISDGRSD